MTVYYQNCSTIFIPNVFSPNNDGVNDIFKVRATNLSSFNFQIFNRWGQLLFETNNNNEGWDGKYLNKDVSPGVYVWLINAKDKNGSVFYNGKNKGTITLVR